MILYSVVRVDSAYIYPSRRALAFFAGIGITIAFRRCYGMDMRDMGAFKAGNGGRERTWMLRMLRYEGSETCEAEMGEMMECILSTAMTCYMSSQGYEHEQEETYSVT